VSQTPRLRRFVFNLVRHPIPYIKEKKKKGERRGSTVWYRGGLTPYSISPKRRKRKEKGEKEKKERKQKTHFFYCEGPDTCPPAYPARSSLLSFPKGRKKGEKKGKKEKREGGEQRGTPTSERKEVRTKCPASFFVFYLEKTEKKKNGKKREKRGKEPYVEPRLAVDAVCAARSRLLIQHPFFFEKEKKIKKKEKERKKTATFLPVNPPS